MSVKQFVLPASHMLDMGHQELGCVESFQQFGRNFYSGIQILASFISSYRLVYSHNHILFVLSMARLKII